jgi:hypothetical protein
MNTVIYNGTYQKLNESIELYKKGFTLLCHKCKTPLKIALTHEEANKQKMFLGIICPKNSDHVYLHFHTAEDSQVLNELDSVRFKEEVDAA